MVVGADVVVDLDPTSLGARRSDVVVVAWGDVQPQSMWKAAVALGAEAVIALPAEADRLAVVLADVAEGGSSVGYASGVIGARGGVGASTVAVMLGLVAVARGHGRLPSSTPIRPRPGWTS